MSDAQTRSVSAENVYGEKGRGGMARLEDANAPEDVARIGQEWKPNRSSRELGTKWKVRPCIAAAEGIDHDDHGRKLAQA